MPVAEKRRQAERKLAKLKKQGRSVAPVTIEGRTIAKSFWGKSWCANLERYSDYENRLPRGRTYVRNGSVIDLQIAKGEIVGDGHRLRALQNQDHHCAGHGEHAGNPSAGIAPGPIDSLVELLQGRLAKGVMDRVCREGDGLFPSPTEIKLSCSCPDWADMCKHVAAALYGVGARLDEKPQLLFVLRGVDENELLASAGQDLPLTKAAPGAAKVLDESDVAALFGLEMAETPHTPNPAFTVPKRPQQSKAQKGNKISDRKTKPAAKTDVALHRANSSQFGNEKDNPSKCQQTAHSTATIVFQ